MSQLVQILDVMEKALNGKPMSESDYQLKTFAPNDRAMEFWEQLGFTPRVVQMTSPTETLIERLREGEG